MPKIISGAKEKILIYTKKQLFEQGYASISLREIAKNCHMAVGTIYNYFPNKDTLIASVLLEDWMTTLQQMDIACSNSQNIEEGIYQIYVAIKNFCVKYREIFEQTNSTVNAIHNRHHLLINQIYEKVNNVLLHFHEGTMSDLVFVLSECLLTCAIQENITDTSVQKTIHLLFRKGD